MCLIPFKELICAKLALKQIYCGEESMYWLRYVMCSNKSLCHYVTIFPSINVAKKSPPLCVWWNLLQLCIFMGTAQPRFQEFCGIHRYPIFIQPQLKYLETIVSCLATIHILPVIYSVDLLSVSASPWEVKRPPIYPNLLQQYLSEYMATIRYLAISFWLVTSFAKDYTKYWQVSRVWATQPRIYPEKKQ